MHGDRHSVAVCRPIPFNGKPKATIWFPPLIAGFEGDTPHGKCRGFALVPERNFGGYGDPIGGCLMTRWGMKVNRLKVWRCKGRADSKGL